MIGWPRSGTAPVVFSVAFLDRKIVDASVASPHQAVFAKLPVFVPVRAKPIEGVVVPFVGKANRDPVAIEGPKLLDETIVEFAGPLPGEKGDDLRSALHELGTVPPITVHGIRERDPRWIACVPPVLGAAYLLDRRLARERRKWR